MKYLQSSFSVNLGGKAYEKGWQRTFGKCPTCKLGFSDGPFCPDPFHKDDDGQDQEAQAKDQGAEAAHSAP